MALLNNHSCYPIIIRNFNLNLLSKSSTILDYLNIIESSSFGQLIAETTRETDNSRSLLDRVAEKYYFDQTLETVVHKVNIIDRYPIELCFTFRATPPPTNSRRNLKFLRSNKKQMFLSMLNSKIQSVFGTTEVNNQRIKFEQDYDRFA